MDNGKPSFGKRSLSTLARKPSSRHTVPKSPLWQNTHAEEEHAHASKVRNGHVQSGQSGVAISQDDLPLLPPASLSFDGSNEQATMPARGVQDPLAATKPTGVRSMLRHRLSGYGSVHGKSNDETKSHGHVAAAEPPTATNYAHTGGTTPESQSARRPMAITSSAPTSSRSPQEASTQAAQSVQNDEQRASKSKGMLSGLSRKGSKMLRRATGSSKSDTELLEPKSSHKTSPVSTLSPLASPKSPETSSTLSPVLSERGSSGNKSSPGIAAISRSVSMISFARSESASTPSSPQMAGQRTPLMSPRSSRRMDELTKAFLTLDKDHERYHSRKVVLKMNIIRDCVLPFLRTWISHPLNTSVTAEDLQVRAIVLSKWWTTLLDALKENHNEKTSSHDRQMLLESLTGIMERPEWRLALNDSIPGLDVTPSPEHKRRTSSTSSCGSAEISLIIEKATIGASVCGLFTHHLAQQMTFVVDRMSQRTTPTSLVSFCGRACAYAFFFCPGVADMLVRLWNVRPAQMKRVLRAANVRSPFRFQTEANNMAHHFPACLHSLSFLSLRDATAKLQQPCTTYDVLKGVDWRGYWIKRWSGKDSDLFYAFIKQYHILLADHVPPDTPKGVWLFAPTVLPVFAQILANLDMTIHRQSAGAANPSPAKGKDSRSDRMFDDIDVSADAFAPASINATRIMCDNRLVTLLKDLLSLKQQTSLSASRLFALGFCDVLKAAACHTSVYDHHACFTLCDFLEEALAILGKFEANISGPSLIDWEFWMDVFSRMLRSENTLTQIRLYALLFTIWPLLDVSARWKEHLCLNILLMPAQFQRSFSHYCPLVRTYYHRLLCWRLARCDGKADVDIRILCAVQERLYLVDNTFRALQKQAQSTGRLRLDTEPGTPAPNRRLLIIRTDMAPSPTTLMLEGFVPRMENNNTPMDLPPPALDADGGVDAVQLIEKLNLADNDPDEAKKKGSMLRSLIGSRSPKPTASPASDSRSQSPTRLAQDAALQTPPEASPRSSMHRPRPPINSRTSGVNRTKEQAKPNFRQAYFKFSLELVDKSKGPPKDIIYHKHPPRLPAQWQYLLDEQKPHHRFSEDSGKSSIPMPDVMDVETSSRYAGMALAEWHLVVNECQNFFERRRREGVPENRLVETPTLGVESLKRPG